MPSLATPGTRSHPALKALLAFTAGLLVLRLLGMYTWYFWEEDELSLVAGVAALVSDQIGGGLYRYSPQLGYYRLLEGLMLLGHLPLTLLPYLAKIVSALSGVAIPVLGLFLARDKLTPATRWVLAGMLAINPIIWHSARYGNTAMLQMALAFGGIVLLSNRVKGWRVLVALLLIATATLVRADAVLLWPLIALLVWRAHEGKPGTVVRLALGFVLVVGTIYALAFAFDPRMDNLGAEVAEHVLNDRYPTLFWEYLLWSISPVPLMFAVVGARRLLLGDRAFGSIIAVWCAFPFLFYFGSTTTPRYFLLTVIPITVLSALGVVELAQAVVKFWRPALVRGALIGALSIHLFVGLGHFTPDGWRNPFLGPSFRTHDGVMPTGGLLYFTYNPGGVILKDLSRFGLAQADHDGFQALLEDLKQEARPGRTAVILLNTGFGHAFHYYALSQGAEYRSRAPGMYFATETWLQLDGMDVMTIATWSPYFENLGEFPVKRGDIIYVLRDYDFPGVQDLDRLADGVSATQVSTIDPFFQRFDVVEDSSASD